MASHGISGIKDADQLTRFCFAGSDYTLVLFALLLAEWKAGGRIKRA